MGAGGKPSPLAAVVYLPRILGRFAPIIHAVVTDNLRDAEAVVDEDSPPAGELGVFVYNRMVDHGVLRLDAGGVLLTEYGKSWFRRIGVDPDVVGRARRSFCRACLDWSERRHHLAGALGTVLLARIYEFGWAKRAESSRVVVFADNGEESLRTLFTRQDVH